MDDNKEKEMSEIELEVGQVWKSTYPCAVKGITVLKLFSNNGSNRVGYFYQRDDSCGILDESIEYFRENRTLITNADGTPHVKPNDYQDGDIWQSLITSALYSFWNGTYRDVFDVSGDSFRVHKSSPLITEPEEYKLIYRDGQGVINDA